MFNSKLSQMTRWYGSSIDPWFGIGSAWINNNSAIFLLRRRFTKLRNDQSMSTWVILKNLECACWFETGEQSIYNWKLKYPICKRLVVMVYPGCYPRAHWVVNDSSELWGPFTIPVKLSIVYNPYFILWHSNPLKLQLGRRSHRSGYCVCIHIYIIHIIYVNMCIIYIYIYWLS